MYISDMGGQKHRNMYVGGTERVNDLAKKKLHHRNCTGTLMKLIKIDLAQVCENVSVRKKATLMGHGYFFTASFVAC